MNWERAVELANTLAAEGQHVIVVDTINMPAGHLSDSANILTLAVDPDTEPLDVHAMSEAGDVLIWVTPSRPWAPRKEA